ncbi:unnamed protein product [Tetraodon nigroviridis]|uniref:Chromosome 8 SCAF15119, whole genome shotgun sequence n=1 Tax=Tetraodon nigroviridis TaxID=99883 RepID=Q4RFH9_TETNG|nr:unnamed protein product [Tetraodon nigroviridis]
MGGGSGREQKGQSADSPLAGTGLVSGCWPMGILTHLMHPSKGSPSEGVKVRNNSG